MKSVILLVVEMLQVSEFGFAFLKLSPRDRFPSESRWAMTLLPSLPSGCHINGADNSKNQIQKSFLNDFETIVQSGF